MAFLLLALAVLVAIPVVARVVFRNQRKNDDQVGACLSWVLPPTGSALAFAILFFTGEPANVALGGAILGWILAIVAAFVGGDAMLSLAAWRWDKLPLQPTLYKVLVFGWPIVTPLVAGLVIGPLLE